MKKKSTYFLKIIYPIMSKISKLNFSFSINNNPQKHIHENTNNGHVKSMWKTHLKNKPNGQTAADGLKENG